MLIEPLDLGAIKQNWRASTMRLRWLAWVALPAAAFHSGAPPHAGRSALGPARGRVRPLRVAANDDTGKLLELAGLEQAEEALSELSGRVSEMTAAEVKKAEQALSELSDQVRAPSLLARAPFRAFRRLARAR